MNGEQCMGYEIWDMMRKGRNCITIRAKVQDQNSGNKLMIIIVRDWGIASSFKNDTLSTSTVAIL